METKKDTALLYLSLPASLLIGIVSCVGLFSPDFYNLETLNWQAQSIGQDIVDLFLVMPVLLISACLAYRRKLLYKQINKL